LLSQRKAISKKEAQKMELKAHLQEFGALAQFLSPEKSEVFRRTNFEYLIQLNNRNPEEAQTIFWEGICTNLTRRLTGLQHADSGQNKSEALQTAINLSIFLPKITASSAMDQITPIQTVTTEFPNDEGAGVSLSAAALSRELTAQAFNDLREALYAPKEHSKWLLISAYKQFHAACKLDPKNYFAQFNYGYLHGFFFRKPEKAAQHFEAAVANAFEKDIAFTVFALRHLAETRREMGQIDAAIEAANEALMLDRDQTLQIRYDLARYLSLAGQHEKAFGYLEELLSEHSEFYWQAISEPDFAENRDIVTLLNALSQVYLELDDTISPTVELSIDENDLANILDENERINSQRRQALDLKALLKEAHKLIRSSRRAAPDAGEVRKPEETKKPIIIRPKKETPTGQVTTNGHNGKKTEASAEPNTPDDILNLAKSTAEKNPPPDADEGDTFLDEYSPEVERMLDQIREAYFQRKEEALKEKSRPLSEAEMQRIREQLAEERRQITESRTAETSADTPVAEPPSTADEDVANEAENDASEATKSTAETTASASTAEAEDEAAEDDQIVNLIETIGQRLQAVPAEADVDELLPDIDLDATATTAPQPEAAPEVTTPETSESAETEASDIPEQAAEPDSGTPVETPAEKNTIPQPNVQSEQMPEREPAAQEPVALWDNVIPDVPQKTLVQTESESQSIDKYVEQIETEVANAIRQCRELESIFTRSDMLETIHQIRSIGKEFLENLPNFSPDQRAQKTRQVIDMIREAVFLFQHRHPLVAKLRGIKLDDYR
jgi:tetratricopeptide (TPR) repeat protein